MDIESEGCGWSGWYCLRIWATKHDPSCQSTADTTAIQVSHFSLLGRVDERGRLVGLGIN